MLVEQGYCDVRRAAAEKLFTHSNAAADDDSDTDSDARPAPSSKRGAAAAAAAAAAAEQSPAGYTAAEGQRQRKALLNELRLSVPQAC